MLLLDTNVVSELMRPAPDPDVVQWLQGQPLEQLAITAISVAEILYGLDRLPDGRRKANLVQRFQLFLTQGFAGRVLPFDRPAAEVYASIKGRRDRAGRPVSGYDAMIAAIASSRGAGVATRNVADFTDCGVVVINPWSGQPS
jgi:predicted nucleic acid-binding protein